MRFEEGLPSEAWHTECIDLVHKRATVPANITRVVRIHNRFIRSRLDRAASAVPSGAAVFSAAIAANSARRRKNEGPQFEYLFFYCDGKLGAHEKLLHVSHAPFEFISTVSMIDHFHLKIAENGFARGAPIRLSSLPPRTEELSGGVASALVVKALVGSATFAPAPFEGPGRPSAEDFTQEAQALFSAPEGPERGDGSGGCGDGGPDEKRARARSWWFADPAHLLPEFLVVLEHGLEYGLEHGSALPTCCSPTQFRDDAAAFPSLRDAFTSLTDAEFVDHAPFLAPLLLIARRVREEVARAKLDDIDASVSGALDQSNPAGAFSEANKTGLLATTNTGLAPDHLATVIAGARRRSKASGLSVSACLSSDGLDLTSLLRLSLHSIGISDAEPLAASLVQCSKLTELDLSDNGLFTLTPFAALPALRVLDASFNALSEMCESKRGASPAPFRTLVRLDLRYNEIVFKSTGLPLDLAFPCLEDLDLRGNKLIEVRLLGFQLLLFTPTYRCDPSSRTIPRDWA